MTQNRTSEQPSLHAFVGRKREVEELRAGLNDAMAGRGGLFMLSGEPGIGKTRLAEEISNYASALGMRVLWGRCWEGGGAPAYWPLIQILHAAVADRDNEQLQKLVGPNATEFARLIPEDQNISTRARGAAGDNRRRIGPLSPVRFDCDIAQNPRTHGTPLVVVYDLHDADQPSLQMLRFIAVTIKNAPR